MILNRLVARIAALLSIMIGTSVAAVAEQVGMPTEKGLWLMEPANELARRASDFHELLMVIITIITIFVMVLMIYVMVRFNRKSNPTPSKTTHNTLLEIIWTGLPILILIGIAVPSFRLLYFQDVIPETEFTVQVTGNQWNWTYKYPDHDGIEFTAVMVPDEAFTNASERAQVEGALSSFLGQPAKLNARLLDTDYRMVVPVNTKVRVELTASDVIHSWTVQSFGVKLDAVPGRLNQTWFEVDTIGTYYGQCSELCGKDHAYMPIAVEVVSKEDFAKWVERAKAEFADAGSMQTAFGR